MMGYIDYFLLLLLGLLIIILFLLASQAKSPQRKSTARKVKTNSQDILLGKNFTSHSPIIKLTFEEALDADAFMTEIHDFGLHYAEAACREMFKVENDKKKLPQTQVPLIQNVSIPGTTDNPLDTGKIIWELSKEGRRLFKQGKIEWLKNKKTGKFLPHFPNKRNSKFKDILRSYSTEDIVKISKLVNMAVVNAAHLVSGADQAREMKLIRNKLEYLVDARK